MSTSYFKSIVIFCFIGGVGQNLLAENNEDQRIQDLEQKLAQQMRLIQQMSNELQQLKQSVVQKTVIENTADNNENTERIDELETTVEDLSEQLGSRAVVNAFEAQRLDVGGFLHSTLTHINAENGTATAFNRHIFELLVKAQLSDDWSAFMAQAFIRQSDVLYDDNKDGIFSAGERRNPLFSMKNASPLVIAWANYAYSDALNIQFGRFITPHGIINMEHFPATLLDTEQPQFLRPFSGQTIFPNFVDGVQTYGTYFFGEDGDSLSYNAYISQIVSNTEDFLSGLRLAYNFSEAGITLGVNYAEGARLANQDSKYKLYGLDFLIEKGSLLWKSEIFATEEAFGKNRLAYYTQPAWRISPKWTAFYRYDFLDKGGNLGDSVENVIGLNYQPYSNIRLRGTITHHHFENTKLLNSANSLIYQLSATLSF